MSDFPSIEQWSLQHEQSVARQQALLRTRQDVSPEEAKYLSERRRDGFKLPEQQSPLLSSHPAVLKEEPPSPIEALGDLSSRDFAAIRYAKSRLTEGDTLVVVKYPNNKPVYDATGFLLDTVFRVNSWKLLATGSKVFAKMLSPESQKRARQRPLFKNLYIPQDVQHVLDLTPATDDDEALELVTSLSCPKGILYWSTATRLGVPIRFIGGHDETINPQQEQPQFPSESNTAKLIISREANSVHNDDGFGERIREATQRSLKDTGSATPVDAPALPAPTTKQLPPDYCGVRHCAGIERMLQLIEGKEARLDSAPKVWTVAMLAGFFDCAGSVVDAVCTWVVSQKNGIIIEILPEPSLRLGLVIRSELITRAAFAVLVSEEALCIAGQEENVPFKRGPKTPFGRLREDLDDDILNMIQHAGRSFYDRMDFQAKHLLQSDLPWLMTLPEYQKIATFESDIMRSTGNKKNVVEELPKVLTSLKELLTHYIRGRLFYCLHRELKPTSVTGIEKRRKLEQYITPDIPFNARTAYNALTSQQRIMTRPFWDMVSTTPWTAIAPSSNLLFEALELERPGKNLSSFDIASFFCIKSVNIRDIHAARDRFNLLVFENAIKDSPTAGGPNLTPETIALSNHWEDTFVAETSDHIVDYANKLNKDMDPGKASSYVREMAWEFMRLKTGFTVRSNTPLFDLVRFMEEVGDYLAGIYETMLDQGENPSFSLPETLMCLTDAEYKYLPLFAGGFEDGSGGVYQDELPPAVGGPSGPGPSYHTGFSIASAAGSTADWDNVSKTESTVGGWSRDVDDGNTDHIDRRRVAAGSEISFGSKAFDELGVRSEYSFSEMDIEETKDYFGKGKGKEIDCQSESTDSVMDDSFVDEGNEQDFDFSVEEDDEFDFMDDSDDTATERGDNDEEM